MNKPKNYLARYGVKDVKNYLAHYGVKGMKWGVRKRRDRSSSSSEPEDVKIKSTPGQRVKTSGGRNQPPSEDAKRAAAYKQKAKASSVHSLSNQELQLLVTRMNLEAQYAKIAAADVPQKSKGRKFLEDLIKSEADAAFKGKPGNVRPFVQAGIQLHKKHRTKTAAKAARLITAR